MTIIESLQSLTTYPIPVNAIEAVCINRALVGSDSYTIAINQSDDYQLAMADVYMWMSSAPSITEQEISMSVVERSKWVDKANIIYGKLGASEYSGTKYGFIGESFNGE